MISLWSRSRVQSPGWHNFLAYLLSSSVSFVYIVIPSREEVGGRRRILPLGGMT